MKKFRNKYRIETTRLRHWDYGWNAAYFVTICTRDRVCFFGRVTNGKMMLNDLGLIAEKCWLEIPEHFPFVELGNHVVMPNHVHGIVIINKPDDGRAGKPNGVVVVETQNFASLQQQPPPEMDPPKNRFGPQSQNLASIIRGYKTGVTKQARLICPDFAWQSRYYDHIIPDNGSFERIARYIQNNPAQWQADEWHNNNPKKTNAEK